LFLGRIHPKKGLLNLIDAWGKVRPAHWRLCIAGPDEEGHLTEVLKKVRMLGLEESVNYIGEVEGETKSATFEKADLFVLPSFSENFGVVVAEALAHGVPVITTCSTPWEELPRYGCGWSIEPTADALTETLKDALNMEPADLRAMGEKGISYVRRYDWHTIALQTVAVYQWVLGKGPMPTCVVRE
jgi:glycosyltransferase involved in cell wall biosynthesis